MSTSGVIEGSRGTFKLTPQQYGAILSQLQAAAAAGGSEQRKALRMNVQAPVRLASMADKKVASAFIAITRDISWTGIGLCQHTQFKQSDEFLVGFPCGKHPIIVNCSVMFCRAMADGIYSVGAQFESVATGDLITQYQAACELHAHPGRH
jgi:hypothetical protein